MHDSSSPTYMSMVNHSLPSPEYTGDSDSDSEIIHEIERKRRQLNEEVARFKAQKDREFRDFEADIKARTRQKRAQLQQKTNGNRYYEFTGHSPSATPPTKSMLSTCEKRARSPQKQHSSRHSEPMRLMKPNSGSKVTPATLCLDKMNIRGENLQKLRTSPSQTTPTAASLPPMTNTNQSHAFSLTLEQQATSSSASINSEPSRDKPPLSPEESEHDQGLTGFFVPTYIPLLDGRDDEHQIQQPVDGTQTEPASPIGRGVKIESPAFQTSSLPTASSIVESFQVPSTKRSYTSPSSTTRGTLPPIIRNVNGRKRHNGKRKHVTFQLADRAIVEPSSSYEQGPSPDADDDLSDRRTSDESVASEEQKVSQRPVTQRRHTPRDPFGRQTRTVTPMDTPESEVGMSMGDLLLGSDREHDDSSIAQSKQRSRQEEDGYFSPRHGSGILTDSLMSHGITNNKDQVLKDQSSVQDQNSKRRNDESSDPVPSHRPLWDQFHSSSQDTIRQGYTPKSPRFSPHHSPPTHPLQQQYPGTLEDDLLSNNNNVGFFELDEELSSPTAGMAMPDFPEDKDEDLEIRKGSKAIPNKKRDHAAHGEIQPGSSVPINIVGVGSASLRSSSWKGPYRH